MAGISGGGRWLLVVGVVVALGGCATKESPPLERESISQELRDFSYTALGRGYDRALDTERDDCFTRDPKVVTPINLWEATGFTAFSDYEIATKVKTAVKVGVKIQAVEVSFGAQTASQIGRSSEHSYYVMLARFTSHVEAAGPITGASTACQNLTQGSQNRVEDFVSLCGDRFLDRKLFGGHVLVSWRRDVARAKLDEEIGLNFGAKATDASINAEVNLSKLVSFGYGDEEVFIEASGMPFPPTPVTLPSGGVGFSIKSALDYLEAVAKSATVSPPPFVRVVDYSMERQTVAHMNLCATPTGTSISVTDPEWACVYGTLTELADNRDGDGDRAFLQSEYERHSLAVKHYLPDNRLVFSTVHQSRCSVDYDGDPDSESSGQCQIDALTSFVSLYEECIEASTEMLNNCRANFLGEFNVCSDFQQKCTLPQVTLPDGTVVTCNEDGLNAALREVISYTINPPFPQPPPGGGFSEPVVMEFVSTPKRPIPGVSPTTHLCAITGVKGGLHESIAWIAPDGKDWIVEIRNATPARDKATSLEVSCVNLDNFVYMNGGTVKAPQAESVTVPALNDAIPDGYHSFLSNPGDTSLLGWMGYLSEPQTVLQLTNPTATGYGDYFGRDLFPFESTNVMVGTRVIIGNAGSTGIAGGTIAFQGPVSPAVGLIFPSRQPLATSLALPDPHSAFCYLTGLKGLFYNTSDSVRISTSDGMTTAISATPLEKDRNPGANVQCVYYDRP